MVHFIADLKLEGGWGPVGDYGTDTGGFEVFPRLKIRSNDEKLALVLAGGFQTGSNDETATQLRLFSFQPDPRLDRTDGGNFASNFEDLYVRWNPSKYLDFKLGRLRPDATLLGRLNDGSPVLPDNAAAPQLRHQVTNDGWQGAGAEINLHKPWQPWLPFDGRLQLRAFREGGGATLTMVQGLVTFGFGEYWRDNPTVLGGYAANVYYPEGTVPDFPDGTRNPAEGHARSYAVYLKQPLTLGGVPVDLQGAYAIFLPKDLESTSGKRRQWTATLDVRPTDYLALRGRYDDISREDLPGREGRRVHEHAVDASIRFTPRHDDTWKDGGPFNDPTGLRVTRMSFWNLAGNSNHTIGTMLGCLTLTGEETEVVCYVTAGINITGWRFSPPGYFNPRPE